MLSPPWLGRGDELDDELEEDEIQVFGDCNFKVAAMGKLTDEEKTEFMNQYLKEEKNVGRPPRLRRDVPKLLRLDVYA